MSGEDTLCNRFIFTYVILQSMPTSVFSITGITDKLCISLFGTISMNSIFLLTFFLNSYMHGFNVTFYMGFQSIFKFRFLTYCLDLCVPCGPKVICGSMLATHIYSSDESDKIILKLLGYIFVIY